MKDDPKAATPHVFLARLAREDGDLTTARAQLDTALRLEPKNPIALREMGLILFAAANMTWLEGSSCVPCRPTRRTARRRAISAAR